MPTTTSPGKDVPKEPKRKEETSNCTALHSTESSCNEETDSRKDTLQMNLLLLLLVFVILRIRWGILDGATRQFLSTAMNPSSLDLDRIRQSIAVVRLSSSYRTVDLAGGRFLSPPPLLVLVLRLLDTTEGCLLLSLILDLAASYLLYRVAQQQVQTTKLVSFPSCIEPPWYPWLRRVGGTTSNDDKNNNIQQQAEFLWKTLPMLPVLLYGCVTNLVLSGQSLHSLSHVCILLILLQAKAHQQQQDQQRLRRRQKSLVTLIVAVTTYLDRRLYGAAYLVPLILAAIQREEPEQNKRPIDEKGGSFRRKSVFVFIDYVISFLSWYLALQWLSFLLVGTATGADVMTMSDEAPPPSLGVRWYFQMQVFARFRTYFTVLLDGVPYVFVIPLSVRLWKYPVVLIACFFSLNTIVSPIVTLQDVCFGFCLMLLSPRTLLRMSMVSMIALLALPVPLTLYALDYGLWLHSGSGNANFMYFQCVAISTLVAIVTLDFVHASVKEDKAVRILDKHESKT